MGVEIQRLAERMARLESEVALLRGAMSPPPVSAAPRGTTHAAVRMWAPPASIPPVPPHAAPRPRDPEQEARLVGTWFARVGVGALLLGAAFAFKYAVDQGLIGPLGRVVLGLVAGAAFLVWGERVRARGWPRLAQAVTGGGIGLLYLSVWAAFGLYGLIPAGAAFLSLGVVVAGGVLLAIRHDSEPLVLVALLGGFLAPYLTGLGDVPGPLFGAVLLLDAGAVYLGATRAWRLAEAKALAATWLVALAATEAVAPGLVQAFSVAVFALFGVGPLIRGMGARGSASGDAVLLAANSVAFFLVSMVSVEDLREGLRGEFTLLLAVTHLGAGLLARRSDPERGAIWGTLLSLGLGFVTVAVPLEVDELAVAMVWAGEATALFLIGNGMRLAGARLAAVIVLGLSLLDSVVFEFALGFLYRPERLLVSVETLTLLVQVGALYMAARLLARSGDWWERRLVPVSWIGANVLTVGWLSLEARAAFDAPSLFEDPRAARALQFTYTAIWGLYSAAVLAVGVGTRRRAVRLVAVVGFGLTILKMVSLDLWLLEPLHRTLAFTGLGVLLLAGSLSYHRFRDLILENR